MSNLETIHSFLKYYGLHDHPGMRIKPDLTGYNNYSFGCSAGPIDPNIEDLCHEIGHAVQFGCDNFETRVHQSGFLFFNSPERYHKTCQPILRELETFAIQAHLLNGFLTDFDLDKFVQYSIKLMQDWMYDWYNVPGDNHDERFEYCHVQIMKFYNQYDIFSILHTLYVWLDLTHERIKADDCFDQTQICRNVA